MKNVFSASAVKKPKIKPKKHIVMNTFWVQKYVLARLYKRNVSFPLTFNILH